MRKVSFYNGKERFEREISKVFNHSKTDIHNILIKKELNKRWKDPTVKRIHQSVIIENFSWGQRNSTNRLVKKHSRQVNKSRVTVWRSLKWNVCVNLRKLRSKPQLLKSHKEARLKRVKKIMACPGTPRDFFFFLDEIKINSDGPDGTNYYWHDIRQESLEFYSRQMEEGSAMVRGAFSYAGKCNL